MTHPEDVANEIVENLVDWDQECWGNNRTTQDTIEVIATALRAYGDERAREAYEESAWAIANLDANDIEFDWIKYREIAVGVIRTLAARKL